MDKLSLKHEKSKDKFSSKYILLRLLLRDLVFFEARFGFYKFDFHSDKFLVSLTKIIPRSEFEKLLSSNEFKSVCVEALRISRVFAIYNKLYAYEKLERGSNSARKTLLWINKVLSFNAKNKFITFILRFTNIAIKSNVYVANILLLVYFSLVLRKGILYYYHTKYLLHRNYDLDAFIKHIRDYIFKINN